MSVNILDELGDIVDAVQREFEGERRVLSFEEYLQLFAKDPKRYSRDATRYIKDMFEHFGREEVERPWGKLTRYKLFDLSWLGAEEARRECLIGQELVQGEIYRILSNFTREGRANKLLVLHGPNGSAKSTVARCIMSALEHYSQLEEGALYRFHWVFPSRRSTRGAIGFGDKLEAETENESYAHLDEENIDARLIDEIRDHPLLLLPQQQRKALLERLCGDDVDACGNRWLWNGSLSHKNRTVYDALLNNHDGSLAEVLRHVQVERYFVSRRYRTGAVTVGPELSVDASERQVTADRSLGALPSSLQAVTLFEAHGELVEAAGGLLEFSDLLKRPVDAFKYLQITVETGEFALQTQNVHANCVMLASANEIQLAAFRQHPEFDSFRARLEMIRTPYLLSWPEEQKIYDAQIAPQLATHVAPHATRMAAMFAVLTRLRRPDPDEYAREVRDVVRGLAVEEKLELYATGLAPARLDADKRKLLASIVVQLYQEADARAIYEGIVGASPREMRTVLLDAAQNDSFYGLSPFAVLEELDKLCASQSEYIWLQEEAGEGGYHDHQEFRRKLRVNLLDLVEDEFRVASSLVDDKRYSELFDRYIQHVSVWVKKEKVKNPITGDYEEPDQRLMAQVEALLALPDDAETVRHSWMSQVAAWAIEHPGEPIDNKVIFESTFNRLRDAVFQERREALAKLCRDLVVLMREEGSGLDRTQRLDAQRTLERMCAEFGYEERSAADAAAVLLSERFAADLA